jgi:excisionase family DNA binding protein
MTLQELADYFRVTPKTIYRLLKKRDLPAVRIGHQWRFTRSAVDEWLQRRSVIIRATVLVIDDEETIRKLIRVSLEELGYQVITSNDSFEGVDIVRRRNIDLVFLDLKMPGLNGAEVLNRIKAVKPRLPVTIITGYPDGNIMAQAQTLGPFRVINKPFSESDIIAVANSFLEIRDRD